MRIRLLPVLAVAAVAVSLFLATAPRVHYNGHPVALSANVKILHASPGEPVTKLMAGLAPGQRFAITGRWLCDDKAADTGQNTCVLTLNGSGAQEWVNQPFGSYSGVSLGTVGNGCVFSDPRFTAEYRGDPCFDIGVGGSWLRGVRVGSTYEIIGASSIGVDTSPMVGVYYWVVNINVTNEHGGYPHGAAMQANCLAGCRIGLSASGVPSAENQWATITF